MTTGKQAGRSEIVINVPEYTKMSKDAALPKLTEDWEILLLRVREILIFSCTNCQEPEYLCESHKRDFLWMARMARANIPKRYWSLEIEETSIKPQQALKIVQSAIKNVHRVVGRGLGFSIFGDRGLGKTTLLIYFLKEALRKGYPSYFILMESLLTTIKDSFESLEAKEIVRRIKNVDVLGLDDLGREYMTRSGFVQARLDELLRWRDSMGFSTLLSSNLAKKEFLARYGEGVFSLLSNTNQSLILEGDDLRSSKSEWEEICQD